MLLGTLAFSQCATIAPAYGALNTPGFIITPPTAPGCTGTVFIAVCNSVSAWVRLFNTANNTLVDFGPMNGCSGGYGCGSGCYYDSWNLPAGQYALRFYVDPFTPGTPCASIPIIMPGGANCFSCPAIMANVNDICNDGDPCTVNDRLNGSCTCAGTYTDTDGDGWCDAEDTCPTVQGQVGMACSDGNSCTVNDVLNASCICVGSPIDINDNNACTTDGCDPGAGVHHTPVSTDDGNACTFDGCDPVSGVFHNTVNCDDGNACTTDGCDPASGCTHTTVNCDDGNACTIDIYNCATSQCLHPAVNIDDANACTSDSCDPVTGVHHDPVSTDDGNACTTDTCDPVTGVFHNPVSTDDGSACTTDGCDPVTGVYHNGVNCDDGDPCTTDGCDPVTGCFHNGPISCDDGNACTIDSYNCATSQCEHTPVSTDDSNACTTDGCDPATGVFHTPVNCNDGDPCTTDSCDPILGCQNILPVPCNDNDACTTDSYDCSTSQCVYTPVNIDDANACTTDGCDPLTGVFHDPVGTDDGNACTDDGCDLVTGVFHNAVNCDDGDPCTTDGCDPVTGCYHNGPISCDDGNVCTTDSYNCTTSQCEHTPVSTDDSDACTIDGCDPVTGVFHTPVSTNDGNACTTDGCDLVTGVFHNAVSTDDSNACTTDGCDPVSGVFHNPVSTDDSNACTTDSCDPGTGVFHSNVTNGTSCGVGFQCVGGVCTPIGGCPNNNVSLELQTDANGAQTNWDIVLVSTNTVQCSGGLSPTYPNNTLITATCCLPDGCYELRVKDTFGDGMTTGGYRLKDQFGNRIIDNWGDGVFGSLSQIALNTGFCLDLSIDGMTPTSCDQMNLTASSVLVANERTAVTAQFGITNSTSGYQFLIFNPDGGYVRYVFQSMTTGAGAGAQKSRSLLISSLMTNPVPSFQLLNIRVRSRVAGVYAQFGPACRMKIDPVVPCATTQLDNNPLNTATTLSCGVTGKIVGATSYAGKIYSIPVAGATNYRFRLVSGAYTRIISVTTTYLTLGAWSTQPLLCGNHIYNVDIAISKNSGMTYCPYGLICTVGINNPGGAIPCTAPFGGGSTHAMDMTEESGVLALWPNPNHGDQFYLQMTGISAEVRTVSVDVHDLFSKCVVSEIVTTGGGDLNHVFELGNELASGVYTVTVMAGDQIKTQRLVIE